MREAGMGYPGYMSANDRRARNTKTARQAAENTKQFEANKKRANKLENRLKKLEQGQAKAAPAPAKPATPDNKSQKIEPVKASPQMQEAKSRVQEYQKKDYSSIFKQNETDYTAKFQPSATQSSQPQAANNEKYQFQAPPQTDTTPDKPMTGADILKKDKQQYGSYM